MAKRKDRKKNMKPYSWENPPIGKSEPASDLTKRVPQDKGYTTSELVRKVLKGDIKITRSGHYDDPGVNDVPVARRSNASLISVVDDIRSSKINAAIIKDRQLNAELAKKTSTTSNSEDKPQK